MAKSFKQFDKKEDLALKMKQIEDEVAKLE